MSIITAFPVGSGAVAKDAGYHCGSFVGLAKDSALIPVAVLYLQSIMRFGAELLERCKTKTRLALDDQCGSLRSSHYWASLIMASNVDLVSK